MLRRRAIVVREVSCEKWTGDLPIDELEVMAKTRTSTCFLANADVVPEQNSSLGQYGSIEIVATSVGHVHSNAAA